MSRNLPRPEVFKRLLFGSFARMPELARLPSDYLGTPSYDIMTALVAENDALCERILGVSFKAGANPQDTIVSMTDALSEYVHQMLGGVLVEFSPRLVEQLHRTDLPLVECLPVSDWHLPFDVPAFLRMPTQHADYQTTGASLEGFYVRKVRSVQEGVEHSGFEVVAVAQEDGDSEDASDVYMQRTILLAPTASPRPPTLGELVEQRVEDWRTKEAIPDHLVQSRATSIRNKLELVLKGLIYLNLKETRLSVESVSAQLHEKLEKVGPKKRAKLLRKLERSYDRVVVDVAPAPGEGSCDQSGMTRKPHWRRGHFRQQRFGKDWGQSRLVWIRPIIVGYASAADVEVKRYAIR